MAVRNEHPNVVGDMCTGRGLTGIAALKNGSTFVGTELNKRKLAVFIQRAKRMGYEFKKEL
jgi:methylase of polypeptide subunit release factors